MDIADKLKRVTKVLMAERDHDGPDTINCGDCWLWALLAKKLVPEAELVAWQRTGHVFVRINGKYYDSEVDEGLDTPFELNCLSRHLASEEDEDIEWKVEEKDIHDRRYRFNFKASDSEIESLAEMVLA